MAAYRMVPLSVNICSLCVNIEDTLGVVRKISRLNGLE